MRYTKTSFVFTPEFGMRLRELRRRRSLSLRGLALLMDRNRPGSFNLLAKLERGDLKYPSINLVADYLRACGAGFEDLLDLLKPYTSRPPVLKQKGDEAVAEVLKSLPKAEQRAMLRWERATVETREKKAAAAPEKKKRTPETGRQRAFRIVWSFIHANWNEVFEQKLYEEMRRLGNDVPRSERKHAGNYARQLFGILARYYRHEGRRKGALERVELRARQHGFSDRVVGALKRAAADAQMELERSGRLDWQPTEEEMIRARGHAPKVEKAETRLELDEARPIEAANRTLALIASLAQEAVETRLEKAKLAYDVKKHHYNWIRELIPIAYEHGTDSPEWKECVEKRAPKLPGPEFACQAAEMVADVYNRWKVKLPPRSETRH